MSVKISLIEAAAKAGVTRDKARYWVRLLGIEVEKKEGSLTVPSGTENLLEVMARAVKNGASPSIAALEVKNTFVPLPVKQEPPQVDYSQRFEGIEKVLFALVEEIKTLKCENRALRIQLIPPEKPAMPVIPWKPEPPADPLEGLGFFERIWVQIVEPQKLRQFDS
ncbi:MAG: hypothetical protein Q8L64_00760 [bacterium]|nr:hypothetical protein [bacterium]